MGSVYILVNKDMPGLIKIGYTIGLASKRAKQLSRPTGVPSPFEVAYEVRCERFAELESDMHRELDEYRRPGREFFEYPVEDAIWMLERLHFQYMSIDDALFLLEALHFDINGPSEPLPQNNHPWNQKAKELLLQLADEDVEFNSQEPYNQPDPDQLYLLQLMDWGLNAGGRWSSDLPCDRWEWTDSEIMQEWRYEQQEQYPFADLEIVEQQMLSFVLDMTPKQIMLYLMAFPRHHPEEAICGEMDNFEKASNPSDGAIWLLYTVSEITKTASASLWSPHWRSTWW